MVGRAKRQITMWCARAPDPPAKPAAVCECGESEDPSELEQTFRIETELVCREVLG